MLAPNALVALRALRKAGFLLFLVSNQPNYAKAKASLETLESIHHRLLDLLDQQRIDFAAFYYCLHHPQGVVPSHAGPCRCRKPSPFFLLQARDQFGLDMERSWMVGDRASDIVLRPGGGRAYHPCAQPAKRVLLSTARNGRRVSGRQPGDRRRDHSGTLSAADGSRLQSPI